MILCVSLTNSKITFIGFDGKCEKFEENNRKNMQIRGKYEKPHLMKNRLKIKFNVPRRISNTDIERSQFFQICTETLRNQSIH